MGPKSNKSKKQILILMKTMNIGGAERSLLGLLNAFDYTRYNLSLMVYQHGGEFMKYIPSQVNLLPYNPKYDVFEVSIKSLLFSKKFIYAIVRILAKIELNLYCSIKNKKKNVWINQQYTNKYLVPLLPNIKGKYDLAINFLGVPDVLIKKVNANRKAGWIHTDYNQIVANPKMDLKSFSDLDYIINVSDDCNNVFLKYYPQLIKKAVVIENILSENLIRKQADEFTVDSEMPDNGTIKILSIGRFGRAKNFDNVPEICKIIFSKGFNICWYLIGYGNDETFIRKKIEQFGVQNNVIILGKKENPYPYIKACDIYIQPSRFEGKAVTVREAQILAKPVVIANYETSKSQVDHNVNGIIVPLENKQCTDAICNFINDIHLQNILIDNCMKTDFGNIAEVDKIYNFI